MILGSYLVDRVNQDIPEALNQPFVSILQMPFWFKRLYGSLINRSCPRYALMLKSIPKSTTETRVTYEEILQYRRDFTKIWQDACLDCVICPPNVAPALPHATVMKAFQIFSYTGLYNVLDYPGGTVPVTHVIKEDEYAMHAYPVTDYASRLIFEANVRDTVGLPVGVQCVSLPYNDELCLRVMSEIEKGRIR